MIRRNEADLKLRYRLFVGYGRNYLDVPFLMAVPRTLVTEFGNPLGWEGCVLTNFLFFLRYGCGRDIIERTMKRQKRSMSVCVLP